MADSRLVTPDEIEDLAITVLKDHHAEHLAKLERARGKPPETYERLVTVSHMAAEGLRISSDTLPAALVGVLGDSGESVRNERDALDVPLQLGIQVSVLGQSRRDTLRRRDATAWTVIECLLQRLPRADTVATIRLTDWESLAEADTQRILGDYRIVFEVTVADMVAIVGGLPPTNTPWPPGTPGGPPAAPYDPPEPLPQASSVTYSLSKEPIVE